MFHLLPTYVLLAALIFAWKWEADWRDCSLGSIECTWAAGTMEFTFFSGAGIPPVTGISSFHWVWWD